MIPAIADRLGPDLASLADELGSPVVDAREVTGLRSATLSRATFRLQLRDGRVVKGRRLDRADDAVRIATLGALLDPAGFSRVLASGGTAVLESWVEGQPLGLGEADPAELRTCGALLASIHALAVPPTPGVADVPTAASVRRQFVAGLRDLAAAGVLGRGAVVALLELADHGGPTTVEAGIIHRDLWPANVVRRPDGTLCIVDNGNLTLGAYAFDLARTRHLWPMQATGWTAFLEGYATVRDPSDHEEHAAWWRAAVLTDVANFRRVARTPGRRASLVGLRALAAGSWA